MVSIKFYIFMVVSKQIILDSPSIAIIDTLYCVEWIRLAKNDIMCHSYAVKTNQSLLLFMVFVFCSSVIMSQRKEIDLSLNDFNTSTSQPIQCLHALHRSHIELHHFVSTIKMHTFYKFKFETNECLVFWLGLALKFQLIQFYRFVLIRQVFLSSIWFHRSYFCVKHDRLWQ